MSRRGKRKLRVPFEGLESRRMLAADAIPGQWILQVGGVHGKPDAQLNALNALLSHASLHSQAKRWLGSDGLSLVTTDKNLTKDQVKSALGHLPGFVELEPNYLVSINATVNDPSFSSLWGLNNTGQTGGVADADIDAPEAWDVTKGNGTVVVGDIDTGIDFNHPDLAGAIFTNPNEIAGNNTDDDNNGYIDDVHGWDFYNNDNLPQDDNNHGSHTAGTIGAIQNNGVGIAGVANVKILPLKFLSAGGSGSTADAIAAINYATAMKRDHGINIRVLSNSWGGGGYDPAMYNAIDSAGNQGIMFTAAAGNSGLNADSSPMYPAAYNLANIISVAATDSRDALASFSNYGSLSVDLGAPGVAVNSTISGGGYASYNGTSMATPHVSGVAALIFSAVPGATVAQAKSAILNGVDPITALAGKSVSGGRLNARKALDQIVTSPPPPSPPPPPSGSVPIAPTGLSANTASRSRINLSWIDKSSDETGFKIERSTNGSTFTQIGTVGQNVTTYAATGLRKRTTYSFRVRAYNATGNSTYTNTASAVTLNANGTAALASPTTFSITSISDPIEDDELLVGAGLR